MISSAFHRPCLAITALVTAGLLLGGCAAPPSSSGAPPPTPPTSSPGPAGRALLLTELEERHDARVGVYAVDTGSAAEVSWRDDERFAYASTVKAISAAALLDQVGLAGLSAPVPIDAADVVDYSPVTEKAVGTTMTLGEVAHAALTVSDNTAANLMFEALGGPAALDARLADLGDDTTVVARTEPDLNEAVPGDDRDTTTPRAFATSLREYLLGDTLTQGERMQLEEWMTATETGDTLVRALLPSDWIVGDKSGSGGYGTRNDLAVVRPPGRAPIIISVMSSKDEPLAARDDQLIAEAAAAAIASLDER